VLSVSGWAQDELGGPPVPRDPLRMLQHSISFYLRRGGGQDSSVATTELTIDEEASGTARHAQWIELEHMTSRGLASTKTCRVQAGLIPYACMCVCVLCV
jgi:hypothetical protein